MANMKIVIAGCRDYDNYGEAEPRLAAVLAELAPDGDVTVISGGCRGADKIGERYAREHGLEVIAFPADWKKHGRAAGPIRNAQMAKEADAAVCFWDGKSRGTKSMLECVAKAGKVFRVIDIPVNSQSKCNSSKR